MILEIFQFLIKLYLNIKKIKKYSIDLIVRQIIREIINEMVSDVIKTTKKILN